MSLSVVDQAPTNVRLHAEVGQQWGSLHGGIYDVFEVIELTPGEHLAPPIAAIIPTNFIKVRWLEPRHGETYERAPGHMLGGDGRCALYRRADGTLTDWGKLCEEAKVPKCPSCGKPL